MFFFYRKPELYRPAKVNKALAYLKSKHPSYKNFRIEFLEETNKYMFANLPLIGQLLEDEEGLKNMDDAMGYLRSNSLLMDTLCPFKLKTKKNFEILFENLVQQKTPQNKDSFIHALMDQIR